MADVRISALPAAQNPITGAELVPVVQNGLTVQTTVSAITQSPTQTQPFLTVGQQPTLPNSRYFSTGVGLGITDGGAQDAYTIAFNGTAASLEASGTGFAVKSAASTITPRSLATSGNGISVTNGSGVSGNPTFQLTGLALALANASGTGLLGINGAALSPLTITGAANQIGVTNGNGSGGNPVIGLANNPVIPGNAGVTLPIGSTAQRVNTTGASRFNTDLSAFEGYNGTSWTQFLTSGVTTFSAGSTGFSPSSATAGAVTLGGILNTANGGTGASSLTGYLYGNGSGASTSSTTIPNTSITGLGSISTQSASAVAITGGTINGAVIGATTPASGKFTAITFSSQIANATTVGTVNINWTTGNYQFQASPTGTITYAFVPPAGVSHLQLFVASSVTAQIVVWPANLYWLGVKWVAADSKSAIINIYYDGSNYYAIGTNQV